MKHIDKAQTPEKATKSLSAKVWVWYSVVHNTGYGEEVWQWKEIKQVKNQAALKSIASQKESL
jgi:hypothetical protein